MSRYKPGDDVAGAVVVEMLPVVEKKVRAWRLRCECQATFVRSSIQIASANYYGKTLRCEGCDPPAPKAEPSPSAPRPAGPGSKSGVTLPPLADVVAMRREGHGYHAISVRFGIDRNYIYQMLRDAGEVLPFNRGRKQSKKGVA